MSARGATAESRGGFPLRLSIPRERAWTAAISLLPPASLFLLAIVVFAPSLRFGFLNWDDPWYVLHNPLIRSWHPANLYQIATGVVAKNYAPLNIFSYLVDRTLWGEWAGGYHATNVLLHAVNAVLVYRLVVQLTESRFIAWTTAALFAVHPVQVETVAWIASRKGLLSGAFMLAALLYWLRPERTRSDDSRGLLWFALALLAKALAVVLPAIVLAYDVIVLREPVRRAVRRQIVPGLMALALLLVTAFAQTSELGGLRGHLAAGKLQILAADSIILWRYVAHLVVPVNLCVLYDPPITGIAVQALLATAGWIGVGLLAFRVRRTMPLVPFALAASLILLLPVLNLVPITTLMNDRYLYLPCIPLFALAAAAVVKLCACGQERCRAAHSIHSRGARAGQGAAIALVLIAVVLSARQTVAYLPVWRDGLTLWTYAAGREPRLAVVQIQLANALHEAGRNAEALAALERALWECRPDALDRERIEQKLAAWGAAVQNQ